MSAAEGPLGGAANESIPHLRLVPATPCVIWTGSTTPKGYGRRRYQGKVMGAHRAAWIEANGPIPGDLTVDHICFNPTCVNVDHLRLLTRSENSANNRKSHWTHCIHGHEFTPENTYLRKDGHGKRECITCRDTRAAARRAMKRRELGRAA